MGTVLLGYKITCEDQDMLDSIEERLKKIDFVKIQELKRVPFVFGTELIRIGFTFSDKESEISQKIEEYLESIEGINFENDVMTLI